MQTVCNATVAANLTKHVGQLVEVGQQGEIKARFCSGFNFQKARYFLTAGHCVTGCTIDNIAPDINNCVVNFGFEMCNANSRNNVHYVKDGEYAKIRRVEHHGQCRNPDYDYAVLTLDPGIAGKFQSLELPVSSVQIGQEVFIVHHPGAIFCWARE